MAAKRIVEVISKACFEMVIYKPSFQPGVCLD